MTPEAVEQLRFAIVKQACNDYNKAYFDKRALNRKKLHTKLTARERKLLQDAEDTETECLEFFHSGWYKLLCDIEPEELIRGLRVRRIKDKDKNF